MIHSYQVPDRALSDRIQEDLERFAKQWRQEETIGSPEPIDAFCDVLLRGGKRLRGTLAAQSYWAHGGRNETVAIGAARVFELIQTSLLVVDDIADRSALRRGGPSAHTRIEAYAKNTHLKGSAYHYGQVQAMNVAYAGIHQATIELLNLPVDGEVARRACRRFHENICTTINGQIDDIYNEATPAPVSEADIESVMRRKTAYYTILSPIELGASLAGATELSRSLREYAVHTGCAFQVTDDIISTFGAEDETGKGNNDDIREGKLTLLVYHALLKSDATQQKLLWSILGKSTASDKECDRVREIMKRTGALDYAKERSARHEAEAVQALSGVTTLTPDFKAYLGTLTKYVVNRSL